MLSKNFTFSRARREQGMRHSFSWRVHLAAGARVSAKIAKKI